MVIKRSNRFETIKQISKGEYGSVFLAIDHESGTTVQITSLFISTSISETILNEIEQDIYKLKTLKNDHILPIQESIRDGDRFYIVSEFFDGETLEERLSYSSIDLNEAIRIIRQVGDALTALHAAGMIHGDLKPSHILLSKAGNVYLSGFEIYQHASAMYEGIPQVLIGPLGYMSPEQAQGTETVDERSDL
jgi:serine/threonine protein kinase